MAALRAARSRMKRIEAAARINFAQKTIRLRMLDRFAQMAEENTTSGRPHSGQGCPAAPQSAMSLT
jgi:hypothetical protein